MENKAVVYLIPIPIADGALHTLSTEITQVTAGLKHYFVENIRTARRFLKSIHPDIVIDDIYFSEIDKHAGPDIHAFKNCIKEGRLIGIMSEAGCPGVADPGALLVHAAHEAGATVYPLTGPNSIILALMASGMNGQSFCFHGYLPLKDPGRSKKIKELEQVSAKEQQAQIFIETPYRNNSLLDDLLKHCNNHTRLCIASNLTAQDGSVRTKTISEWKKNKPVMEKQPAVFIISA